MAFARQLEPASSASFGPLVERTPQKVRHGQGPRKPTHLGVVGQLFLSNWASIMSIIWAFGGGTPRTVRRGQGPIKLKHLRVAGRLLSSNLEAWHSIMSIIWVVSAGKAAKKRDVGRGQVTKSRLGAAVADQLGPACSASFEPLVAGTPRKRDAGSSSQDGQNFLGLLKGFCPATWARIMAGTAPAALAEERCCIDAGSNSWKPALNMRFLKNP